PNNSVLLTITNNTIAIATSNHVRWLDGAKPADDSKAPRNFLVGTTNLIHAGGDAEAFFGPHPAIGAGKPTRIWVLGDPGTRQKAQREVRGGYYKWTG